MDSQPRNFSERFHLALIALTFKPGEPKLDLKRGEPQNWLHTLNGSALAAGRALIAVIENNFDQKGTITAIPEALHDYTKFSIDQGLNKVHLNVA